MQSYPSPNAMAADSAGHFYLQPSSQQQQQQQQHQHQQQQQQQQQQTPSLSNSDELQLTAQLSRGLAPIMNAGPGGGLPEGQDPRGNVNQYHHDQSQGHAMHLQQGLGQMDQMGGQYGSSPDASNRKRSKVSRACDECRRKKIRCDATEESADQQCTSCKRVGTRCQFSRVPMKRGPSKGYIKELADRLNTLESAVQANEMPVAQYLHQDPNLQRRGSDEYSPPPNVDNMPRKRTYSTVSAEFGTPYQPQRQASAWPPQEPSRHLPHPSSAPFATSQSAPSGSIHVFRDANYSPNGLPPTPQWRTAPEPLRRQSSSFEGVPQVDHSHSDRVSDWDESIVDGYYNFIHPTYPLLSLNKNRLSSKLANCPAALREAFHEALYAAVRSFPTSNASPPEQQSSRKAAQLIISSQFENAASRTTTTNLIYLQIMLLMAIEADNRDPASARGQAGQSQSVWLGSAVGLAYSTKLHMNKGANQQSESDPDSEEKLARRVWWSLVIMDRWHAASTASPLLIPDSSVVVYPEDQALLGESLYQLARLSVVLGHFTLIPIDLPPLSVPAVPLLSTLLRGELERLRESLPSSFFPPSNSPLFHLCYWYLRILMAMRLPESEPKDLLDPALNIVTQLKSNSGLTTPLTHHATAFAAATLIQLKENEQTRTEAESGLSSLLEGHIAPSGWDSSIREMIVKSKNSAGSGSVVGAKTGTSQMAAQGLQRLADLATATEEGRTEGATSERQKESPQSGEIFQRFHDLRELVRIGYLSRLGEGGETAR